MPHKINELEKDCSLSSIVRLTEDWLMLPEMRLSSSLASHYASVYGQVIQTAKALGLRETKYPNYADYDAVVIFGSTGLSYFKILQDLIYFYERNQLTWTKIILLGGDRPVNIQYDSLRTAYRYFPELFNRQIADEEIAACTNEMDVMNMVTSVIKFPDAFKSIPIESLLTHKNPGEKSQASTHDTLVKLLKHYKFSGELPILFLGTLPYIVRQGLQAKMLMPDYKVDTAYMFGRYLETIDTALKGDLPAALYLDEFHCLFYNMNLYDTD